MDDEGPALAPGLPEIGGSSTVLVRQDLEMPAPWIEEGPKDY